MLRYISARTYDVLLSNLHMPGAGDGLTVVSTMRHANRDDVTLFLSAFTEMSAAAMPILMHTHESWSNQCNYQIDRSCYAKNHQGLLQKRKVETSSRFLSAPP